MPAGWGGCALLFHALEILQAQDEASRQVLVEHDRVDTELLRRAVEEYLPLEEQVGTVGDAERLLNVVVCNEHAYVPLFQFPDDVLNVFHSNGIDTGKGLVEHDELRVDGKATGYLRAATLASTLAMLSSTLILRKTLASCAR